MRNKLKDVIQTELDNEFSDDSGWNDGDEEYAVYYNAFGEIKLADELISEINEFYGLEWNSGFYELKTKVKDIMKFLNEYKFPFHNEEHDNIHIPLTDEEKQRFSDFYMNASKEEFLNYFKKLDSFINSVLEDIDDLVPKTKVFKIG